MDHKPKKKPRARPVVDETGLPAPVGRRMLLRLLPAVAVAAGVLVFQAARDQRRPADDGPAWSAAERSTRALLTERTAVHLRALRPR
jgi:hypothetical protein